MVLILAGSVRPAWADDVSRRFNLINGIALPALALADGSSALPLNPGASGAVDLFELYLSKSINPNTVGQFNAFVGLPGLSLGFQQFQGGLLGDLRKYCLGYAFPVMDMMHIGIGYSLTQEINTANSNIHSFDAGMLLRPAKFLSVGATIRNLNAPLVNNIAIKRAYAAGVGLRPFGERLTLTADAQWDEGDDVKLITGMFGVEAEPLEGIVVRGQVDTRGQFGLGVSVQLDHFNAGYYHTFNHAATFDGVHAKITNKTVESVLNKIGVKFAYLDLTQGLELDHGDSGKGLFRNSNRYSFWRLVEQLERVRQLERYQGVVLDISHLGVGLGAIEELRTAIKRVQQAGKKVLIYLRDGRMGEYYLASAADHMVMHPLGSLEIAGFAYVLPYYKKLLDKLGVEVEFIRVGQYKTGLESYTSEQPSDPTKEQLTAVQDDDFKRYMEHLIKGRHLEQPQVDKILAKGLLTAREAKDSGLVDDVGYRDQVPEMAAKLMQKNTVDLDDIEHLDLHDKSWESRDKIAVIYVSGSIVDGQSGNDLLMREQFSGAASVVAQIAKARQDQRVKALVLRVNSPGGSALASDEIYRALKRYKELTGRPVVVSMGDVAASGGYWIAMAGDKILANPSTLTGSIGIFAGKTNLKGLYDLAGIQHTVIKTSPAADANGNHRAFTPDEKQSLQNHLREYYRIFLERVSDNRKLAIEQVEEVAQGRVYTGQQALDKKLIDRLGGLADAIALARQMAAIQTAEIELEHLPNAANWLASIPTNMDQLPVGQSISRLFPQGVSVLALTPQWGMNTP